MKCSHWRDLNPQDRGGQMISNPDYPIVGDLSHPQYQIMRQWHKLKKKLKTSYALSIYMSDAPKIALILAELEGVSMRA